MSDVKPASDPIYQYAIINSDNIVVNRIGWNGQGDIWLHGGQRYVIDDASAYPIGSIYTGEDTPSVAPNYY